MVSSQVYELVFRDLGRDPGDRVVHSFECEGWNPMIPRVGDFLRTVDEKDNVTCYRVKERHFEYSRECIQIDIVMEGHTSSF